jgi:hypothetical protein
VTMRIPRAVGYTRTDRGNARPTGRDL